MLSTTRRRALAALAATTLAAGLAVAGAAPAQALPGAAVTLVDLTGTFAPSGGGRELTLNADLTVADPANPGTIVFTIEPIAACGVAPVTSEVTIATVDHDGSYVFPVSVPASGVVRVYAVMSDGAGGEVPLGGNYPFWDNSEIPGSVSTTLTPSPTTEGTGHLTFSVGTALAGYPLSVYVDGSLIGSPDVGYCDDEDFAYAGFAAGQTIEVMSFLTGSTVLATFEIPDLPTQAIDPPAAPQPGASLAVTGVDALPYLTLAALLLGAGAATVLMTRRRRAAR